MLTITILEFVHLGKEINKYFKHLDILVMITSMHYVLSCFSWFLSNFLIDRLNIIGIIDKLSLLVGSLN